MGEYTDSGHPIHILLCFSLSPTSSKGREWARRCSRLLGLPHRLPLPGLWKPVQVVQQVAQLEASCTAVQNHLPPSHSGSHPTLCSQHWSRTAELSAASHKRPIFTPHNCSTHTHKKRDQESWQPMLNLHAYLISCIFRYTVLQNIAKLFILIFFKSGLNSVKYKACFLLLSLPPSEYNPIFLWNCNILFLIAWELRTKREKQ